MILVIFVAVVMLVALFSWQPWDDDSTANPGTGTEEGAGDADTDVDIDGDINVDDGTGADDGTAPSQAP
jgi:hypothetical protein